MPRPEISSTVRRRAILWRSLEKIPETYRLPLVLFYREHQAVEAVAEKLELTPDSVRPRLSRGGKLVAEGPGCFEEPEEIDVACGSRE